MHAGDELSLQEAAEAALSPKHLNAIGRFVVHLRSQGLRVPFEDDDCAVVFKPPGVHTKAGSNHKYAALEDAVSGGTVCTPIAMLATTVTASTTATSPLPPLPPLPLPLPLPMPLPPVTVHDYDSRHTHSNLTCQLPAELSPPLSSAWGDALPRPLVMHRLDVPVAGLCLVAKTRMHT